MRLHVLKGVDLAVARGEFLAIKGASGSGKSTMLNILGCLDRTTEGDYILDGENTAQLSDDRLSEIRNDRIGFIFQSYNLISQLTVLENVEVPQLYGNAPLDHDRCRELLSRVGLSERLTHRPAQLSGGECQRVAIARALVNDPVLLLADEPTGNLDTKTGDGVLAVIQELHAQGRTIVMISHDRAVADRAQRGVHLVDGAIAQERAS